MSFSQRFKALNNGHQNSEADNACARVLAHVQTDIQQLEASMTQNSSGFSAIFNVFKRTKGTYDPAHKTLTYTLLQRAGTHHAMGDLGASRAQGRQMENELRELGLSAAVGPLHDFCANPSRDLRIEMSATTYETSIINGWKHDAKLEVVIYLDQPYRTSRHQLSRPPAAQQAQTAPAATPPAAAEKPPVAATPPAPAPAPQASAKKDETFTTPKLDLRPDKR